MYPKRRPAEGQRRQWKQEHPPSSHDLRTDKSPTNVGPKKNVAKLVYKDLYRPRKLYSYFLVSIVRLELCSPI